MAKYIVNTQAQLNGDHEVHNESTCSHLPLTHNRLSLGEHATCVTAVAAAKKIYPTADGCAYCAPYCHSS